MNGFFIITEISELQQFLKVDQPAAAEMIKNCNRSVNNTLRSELLQHGSFLIFPVEAEIGNSQAVVETAINLLEVVNGYREEIHDFSMMLIFRRRSEISEITAELKQTYFSKCEDKTLLIERRIAEHAGLPDSEDLSGLYPVKLEDKESAGNGFPGLEKLVSKPEVERLLKLLIPVIDSESEQRVIILTGGPELSIRLNLSRAIRDASGKNKSAAAVYIDVLDNEHNVIMPFARSIDRQLVPVVEENLDGIELKTWLASKSRLDTINSDYQEEYFFSVFSLYLKGILKFFKKALQPPVIVFSGINKDSLALLQYAQRVIGYIENEIDPIIFFINGGNKDDFTSLFTEGVFKYYSTRACCSSAKPSETCSRLNYKMSRLLYILNLTEGLFDADLLEAFLTECGYNSVEISSGLKGLESDGCIINGRYLRVIKDESFCKISDRITDKEEIFRILAGFVENNIYNGSFYDYRLAAERLSDFASSPEAGKAVYSCLAILLNLNRTEDVRNYLSENMLPGKFMTDAIKLRCSLLENDKDACLKILKTIPERPESPENMNDALIMLGTAEYFHSIYDYQRALDYVKKVLIYLQAGDYPRLEGVAFIELGFLMLCKGKLLESAEYLNLAVEKLTGTGDSFNLMKAWLFTAIMHYIWGSLDDALDSADKALNLAEENGFGEWLFYSEFFICRLYFELGRYYDAEKKLSECLLRSEIYRNDQRRRLFSAWTARACVYQGKIYRGMNMLLSLEEDPEILFFLAEAYFFNGNMERALDSIEKAGSSDEYFQLGFSALEHVSWKNGYSSIEDRILQSAKGTGVLLHNVRAMHAYLLGMTGNREYGIEILFSLTRDEKISEIDPFNRIYFYFYCQMIEYRQNAEIIDKLTLISKALKYLQQTSSRITDPKIRQQYMNKNYWNARLVSEARKEKLI